MNKPFTPQAHVAKSGASVSMDKAGYLYTVILRTPGGDVQDKTRCDDYRMAREYYAAFKRIADKGQGGRRC